VLNPVDELTDEVVKGILVGPQVSAHPSKDRSVEHRISGSRCAGRGGSSSAVEIGDTRPGSAPTAATTAEMYSHHDADPSFTA
jgi:hypothetical protein